MSVKTFVIMGLPIIGVLLIGLFALYIFIPTWFKALFPCVDVLEPKSKKEVQIVEVPVIVHISEDPPPSYQ